MSEFVELKRNAAIEVERRLHPWGDLRETAA